MKTLTLSLTALLLTVGMTMGQAVTFTGDVAADFPATQYYSDPGGMDVGIPASLMGAVSGWDIKAMALSYDEATDTLYCGIDTFGIAGDADGDGNPGGASAGLLINGGDDIPNFGGTEAFTFGLDLNDDGFLDIVAGTPLGSDLSGFMVATYNNFVFLPSQNPLSDPYNRFGTPLPGNTGTVAASPSAAFPDIEFTITNFSALLGQFGQPGNDTFGIHAFMGSLEDDGIGEDYLPAVATMSIPELPCFPIPGDFQITEEIAVPGGTMVTLQTGIPNGYGCCVLYSPFLNQMPFAIVSVPGQPLVSIGITAVPGTISVIDLGIPPSNGNPFQCKSTTFFVPQLPLGTKIYAQNYLYPTGFVSPHITTNVVCFEQM
ncbi:MAG: hypothetical protein R3F20_17410 [Planctomycetota bacterium]